MNDLLRRKSEPLNAVMMYPKAAAIGGTLMALVCGGIGAVTTSPFVAMLMALLGFAIGAPGGSHIAESAESNKHL
jgi:hypothetical protein